MFCTVLVFNKKQGWEFTHFLIAHLLIHSDRSNQMCDCDRFAQITQDKWVTASKSLRSLMSKDRLWENRSGHSRQMSEWANRSFFWANCSFALSLIENERFAQQNFTKIIFFGTFLFFSKKPEWFTHSLFFNERCEQIAQVAHQKCAKWANCLFFERIDHSLIFLQKTID